MKISKTLIVVGTLLIMPTLYLCVLAIFANKAATDQQVLAAGVLATLSMFAGFGAAAAIEGGK